MARSEGCQATSLGISTCKSINPANVKKYFVELSSILTKYNLFDKHHRIFNVDENHAPHVVSGNGNTPQAVTSGKSSTVTILGYGSASGVAIPPYFVFPGMRKRFKLMEVEHILRCIFFQHTLATFFNPWMLVAMTLSRKFITICATNR